MPNHVINIITTEETESENETAFEKIVEDMRSEESQFDFNKLIQMPDDIEETIGQAGTNPPWYSWAIENWGTKWNAYDIRINEYGIIVFQTAWAHPEPIIKALSLKYANIFNVAYADEDRGQNLGIYQIVNGRKIYDHPMNDEKTLFTRILAKSLWAADDFGYLKKEEDLSTGN